MSLFSAIVEIIVEIVGNLALLSLERYKTIKGKRDKKNSSLLRKRKKSLIEEPKRIGEN